MTRTERMLAQAAFQADELRLFLDTHPAEAEPCRDYAAAAQQVRQLRSRLPYAVNALDAGKCGKWDWGTAAFPWEKCADEEGDDHVDL